MVPGTWYSWYVGTYHQFIHHPKVFVCVCVYCVPSPYLQCTLSAITIHHPNNEYSYNDSPYVSLILIPVRRFLLLDLSFYLGTYTTIIIVRARVGTMYMYIRMYGWKNFYILSHHINNSLVTLFTIIRSYLCITRMSM